MYYVYILTNPNNTVLYVGVTNDLTKRVYIHKQKAVDGFTKRYNVTKLVYYEEYFDVEEAIIREKRLKKWKREWKDKLITDFNPKWEELYPK